MAGGSLQRIVQGRRSALLLGLIGRICASWSLGSRLTALSFKQHGRHSVSNRVLVDDEGRLRAASLEHTEVDRFGQRMDVTSSTPRRQAGKLLKSGSEKTMQHLRRLDGGNAKPACSETTEEQRDAFLNAGRLEPDDLPEATGQPLVDMHELIDVVFVSCQDDNKLVLVPALAEAVDHFHNGLLSENAVGEFVSLIDEEDSAEGCIKQPLRLGPGVANVFSN